MTNKKPKKILPPQQWLDSLPAKRVAVQVMFWNLDDQVLMVKPNYRDDWLLPGGIVEAGESPIDAALREVKEELSLETSFLLFAGVDYNPEDTYQNADFIHVFFDGGYLSAEQKAAFQIEEDEIDECRFFSLDELDGFATPQQAQRIREYRKSYPSPMLLTSGQRMDSVAGGQSFQYTTIVASTVIEQDGKYLMVQEEQSSAYGLWNFPSGRVDAGETIEAAAIREAKEESGVDIVIDRKLEVIHEHTAAPVVHMFLAKSWEGTPRPLEGEIMAVDWFSLEEIRGMKDSLRSLRYTLDIIEELENDQV